MLHLLICRDLNENMAKAYSYIRFSSAAQADGDSYRRQLELAQKFCQERDLEFLEEHVFKDLGVSGFDGSNLEGALGSFMESVQDGRIEKGSYLIVESLDRISREAALPALAIINRLLNAGISIVNLEHSPPRILDGSLEAWELILIIADQYRAHSESKVKSERAKALWKQKQKLAGKEPISAKVPYWLRLNPDTNKIEKIPERVRIVKKIFDCAEDGMGRRAIAKMLNEEKQPSWGRSEFWRDSYVAKILNNRAVCGEYQPHETVRNEKIKSKKVRRPVGDPIPNYFPKVITERQFKRVSAIRSSNAPPPGPKGKQFNNLVSGIAHCHSCGETMTLVNKGKPPKGGRYLVCQRAHSNAGCEKRYWPYENVEKLILLKCDELDFKEILQTDETKAELREIQRTIDALTEEKIAVSNRISALTLKLSDVKQELDGLIWEVLEKLRLEESELESKIQASEKEREKIDLALGASEAGPQLQDLMARLLSCEGQERYRLRSRINQMLRNLLESVAFDPLGPARQGGGGYYDEEAQEFVPPTPKSAQIFLKFKSGGRRLVIFSIGRHFDSGDRKKIANEG